MVVTVLLFLGLGLAIQLTGIYVYLIFYNKRTKAVLDRFISQSKSLSPTIFKNIKLRYWVESGARVWIYPNNNCDIYLFDSFLAIVRRQDFIFKVFFKPLVIAPDITQIYRSFYYVDICKPDKVLFKKIIKGEIDIKLTDPMYKHRKIDITLKRLTQEQVDHFEKIRNWAS